MSKLPDYSALRFLVVEDEQFMMNTINRMLRMCGASDIATAHDGEAALRALDKDPHVHCVISDCNMKPINGLQLLQRIRAGANSYIPANLSFLMLTGHGDTDVVQTARQLDVSGYVVKPVAMDTLLRGVSRALDQPVRLKGPRSYLAVTLPKVHSIYQAGDDGSSVAAPAKIDNPLGPKVVLGAALEALRWSGVADGVDLDAMTQNRRLSRILDLVEGDVLAQDIAAKSGAVLLRRGCCLNQTIIDSLQVVAAKTQLKDMIWIGERAA